MTGKRAVESTVENFVIRILAKRQPAYSPTGSLVQDVFSASEIEQAIETAKKAVGDLVLPMAELPRLEQRA